MNVHLLSPGDPLSWYLMPEMNRRIREFCQNYGHDTDPDALWGSAIKCFAAGSPEISLFAVVDEQGLVHGHAVLVFGDWFGRRHVSWLQYAVDKGTNLSRAFHQDCLARVCAWAKSLGATEIRCVADSPQLARAYRTFYGFSGGQRIMLTKEL